MPAVLAGDPEALDRWYRSEHPRVWRLCLGLSADASEADDLAQDAMLHLHDRLPRWDRSRGWSGWRDALVLNLCRDRLRRGAARRRAEDGAASERSGSVLPDPACAAEQAEVQAILLESLRELSAREREAFVLCELEGRETAAVALAMGVGESSVRSLLTLARHRLRRLLAPRVVGEEDRRA